VRISDAEWKAMEVLWDRGAASAREVFDAVSAESGWAYTTVKTMLDRLAEKGAVETCRRGRAITYRPTVSRNEARRWAVRSLLERAFDGATAPLLRFLVSEERLGPAERRELRRLLRQEERRGGGR
jgi:BlaI family penicillinase repressor